MNTQSTKAQIVLREKTRLMSASEIERTLVRLAHEIVEKNNGVERLGFVGIKRRGVPLAKRLAGLVSKIEKSPIDVGTLDINLYRDDLSTTGPKPVVNKMEIGFDVTDKNIILVDDVLYTGRTIRAALDALFDHGRPSRVQLLVLIDRGDYWQCGYVIPKGTFDQIQSSGLPAFREGLIAMAEFMPLVARLRSYRDRPVTSLPPRPASKLKGLIRETNRS